MAGAWAIAATACGDNATNVLAPLDVSADEGASDDARDVSVEAGDVSVEAAVDTSDASIEIPVEAAPDLGSIDAVDTAPDLTPQPDGPLGCDPNGASCSFAGACCTLACAPVSPTMSRICAEGPICAPAGELCGDNGDCCAFACVSSRCVGVTTGCQPAGERCASHAECCGGRCESFDAGESRCALVRGCRVLGEICTRDVDCCSGKCGTDPQMVRSICVVPPDL